MTLKLKWLEGILDGGEGGNNHVPVKERFGEEENENTGLQQPSVFPQVKFGAVWANQKVFMTQMTPLCLDNHSVPVLEVQVLSAMVQ